METNHTKGNWKVIEHQPTNDYYHLFEIESDDYNQTIELARIYKSSALSSAKAEAEANAKLIAAAPEMLDTLEYALKVLRIVGCTEEDEAIIKVKAAIKKATQ